MRNVRARKIRKMANEQFTTVFPGVEEKGFRRNFYRYCKRQWNKDKWLTLKRELKLLSEPV